MKLISTRDPSHQVTLGQAIVNGLAPDGGLYVPQVWPHFTRADFARVETLPEVARILLEPFFEHDRLRGSLPEICAESFSFPIPLRPLPAKHCAVLELFHGPTAAFKDVGARFLAATLQRLENEASTLTILVATSGDTGGAVAAAFHNRPGFEVVVLYPRGMVSPRQKQQLTCWGDNVLAVEVHGTFDDCQRMVKQAFGDPALAGRRLSSANSINIGRLLPQAVYYAAAALWHWRETSQPASFVVPTGNLGNAVAAVWARHMGLPIDAIRLATNANRVIPDFLHSGSWQPASSIATLASAMDVGNPSNMERLRFLYPQFDNLRSQVSGFTINDDQIREQIVNDHSKYQEIWCPHTATAMYVHDHHAADRNNVIVATAHPAKFETIIEPLIGEAVTVPPALAALLDKPNAFVECRADFENLVRVLRRD